MRSMHGAKMNFRYNDPFCLPLSISFLNVISTLFKFYFKDVAVHTVLWPFFYPHVPIVLCDEFNLQGFSILWVYL